MHCNALQRTEITTTQNYWLKLCEADDARAVADNTPQHIATHRNTPPHTATQDYQFKLREADDARAVAVAQAAAEETDKLQRLTYTHLQASPNMRVRRRPVYI